MFMHNLLTLAYHIIDPASLDRFNKFHNSKFFSIIVLYDIFYFNINYFSFFTISYTLQNLSIIFVMCRLSLQ
jgi:hypothetical protein